MEEGGRGEGRGGGGGWRVSGEGGGEGVRRRDRVVEGRVGEGVGGGRV